MWICASLLAVGGIVSATTVRQQLIEN